MNFLKAGLVIFLLSIVFPLQAQTNYCVSADSDTDGDGWGWEEDLSCVVPPGPPLLPDPPVCTTADADSDGDGWGWEADQTCRVDSQTTEFLIEGERVIAGAGGVPVVTRVRPFPEQYMRSAVQASDGTVYFHNPATNLLTSLDRNGAVLWQEQIDFNNTIDVILIDSTETSLYVKMAAGEMASYTVEGNLKWITPSYELIRNIFLTDSSVVFLREDWNAEGYKNNSVVSLNPEGELNWEFSPELFIVGLAVDPNDDIRVTVERDDANEFYIFGE